MDNNNKIQNLDDSKKSSIERQIRGYIGLRNLARSRNENETADEFDNLINNLKRTIE